MSCQRCDDAGWVECSRCEGSGYEPPEEGLSLEAVIDDVARVVTGVPDCRRCDGEGQIPCPRCS